MGNGYSCAMSEPFSPGVRNTIRQNFNWTCTICLTALPTEGSQCAHVFNKSKAGTTQVCPSVTGARALPVMSGVSDRRRSLLWITLFHGTLPP